MQVKIFRAGNMKEALRQVKDAFGQDALILSTRTVRKQRFGFLRAPELEVTAAVENTSKTEQGENPTDFQSELQTQVSGLSRSLAVTYDQKGRLESSGKQEDPTAPASSAAASDPDFRSLHKEMRELRRMISDSAAFRSHGAGSGPAREADPEVGLLMDRGISREAAEEIVRQSAAHGSSDEADDGDLEAICRDRLASWMQVGTCPVTAERRGKRIAFLGPTGVGKTTTLAKLAAHYLQQWGREILLVTIDNYRVAATEQLQVYAQIMNIPLEVVSTPEQLSTVLRRHGVNKLTLIDTAGRNPRNEQGLEELRDFLSQGQGFDKYLVLSATTRDEDMQRIAEQFSPLGLDGLVFTKLDETESYASLVNVQHQTGCPLTYLTDGQKVPEDLRPADPEQISRLIINPEETVLHDE